MPRHDIRNRNAAPPRPPQFLVSFAEVAAGYCGFLRVAGGRICLPPARHAASTGGSIVASCRSRPAATVIRPLGAPMPANVEAQPLRALAGGVPAHASSPFRAAAVDPDQGRRSSR